MAKRKRHRQPQAYADNQRVTKAANEKDTKAPRTKESSSRVIRAGAFLSLLVGETWDVG
jgi:hypothetical protein